MFVLLFSCWIVSDSLRSHGLQRTRLLCPPLPLCFFTTRHIHNLASFLLWPIRFILSGAISNCPLLFLSSILDTSDLGDLASSVICFVSSYCSWCSPGKNTGMDCHSLLQGTTFCQNSSL